MIARQSLFALAKALEGIPVLGSLSGTPAARAGIRYGDVLISVNGMRTRTVLEYVEAKALRTDGMDVVVFRSGTEKLERLAFDEPAITPDRAAILAELITMRIAPDADADAFDGENGGGSSPAA
jgi:predicted metalloprotease with PDZ domain